MKSSQVLIRWREGLHLRRAAGLTQLARSLRSEVILRVNGRIAEARSILSLLVLCAACGATVDLQVSGQDEDAALAAVESYFESNPPDGITPTQISVGSDVTGE